MKLLIQILIICLIIFSLLFAGLTYLFVFMDGKTIVTNQLESLTKRKVTIGSFKLIPPLKIVIKNLAIEGMLKADYISVSPSILAFLGGNIGFNDVTLVKPEFVYEKIPVQVTAVSVEPLTEAVKTSQEVSAPVKQSSPNKPIKLCFIFKSIKVTDGKIDYFDHTVGAEGIKLTIKNVSLKITDLYLLPRKAVANFEFRGLVPWREGQDSGSVSLDGWIDLYKKDMRAKFEIIGIDGLYLYPYYAQWVDLQSTNIEKAKLNFTSNINGLNNDVVADCHLELTDIKFKERALDQEPDKAEKIAQAVLKMFQAGAGGNIVLNFKVPTKMDNPKFGLGLIKGAVEEKFENRKKSQVPLVGNVFLFPIKVLEGAVKATADLSRATIDGTFAIGNELKNGLKESFKKEKID